MVVLFTDPLSKLESRLCYWQKPDSGGRIACEELDLDSLGEPNWRTRSGNCMLAEHVLGHLLMHVARDGTMYGPTTPTTFIDLRGVKIPVAPL